MPANSERQALQRAIEIIGGQAELGRALGVTQSGVWYWCRLGRLPAEFVLKVEALSGIARTRLRPDIYPPAPKKAPKLPAKKPRRRVKPRPRRQAVEAAA
jgi:DNA-binding transcriptional regulator YdaS (Cro superfamily)